MNLKEKTIELRLKGYSYNEINKALGVSKSTLSSWLKEIKLPAKAIARLKNRSREGLFKGLIKRNKNQTILAQKRAKSIHDTATKDVKHFSANDVLIIGVALYWAEGYKRLKVVGGKERTHHPISLTNADPAVISMFVFFLRKIMGIPAENITINLRLFVHMNTKKAIEYWSRVASIPQSQFDKPTFVVSKSSKGMRPFNRLPFGTAQVRVANTKEFHRLMGWIDGMKQQLAEYSKKG